MKKREREERECVCERERGVCGCLGSLVAVWHEQREGGNTPPVYLNWTFEKQSKAKKTSKSDFQYFFQSLFSLEKLFGNGDFDNFLTSLHKTIILL